MSDVPQEKIGQYWQYTFKAPDTYDYATFYGFSEEEAREKYEKYFGVEAPKQLFERQPW